METITGTVNNIRFQNIDNAWTAVNIRRIDGSLTAAAGIMPGVHEGMSVILQGDYENHPKYGLTFKIKTYNETKPADIEGVFKYLASGLIKNIGPELARRITDTFGIQTLDILDNAPERLAEVPGIGKKRLKSIIESVQLQKEIRSIMIWLKRYDLPNGIAVKIYKCYGSNSVATLEENPYRLADDIHGVGFKKADSVARLLNIPEDSSFRILSGLRACLENQASMGNTYVPVNTLVEQTAGEEYLGIDETLVVKTLESMEFLSVGILEDNKAFLPQYYYAEKKIAERLHAIMGAGLSDTRQPDFNMIEQKTHIVFSPQQKNAVSLAMHNPVMIMTGGPGTGKTTTTNAIIQECLSRGYKIILAAPTGRASKRMNESTGHPARTIHRLLEYQQGSFTRNEQDPIDADVIIVDEASMIDTLLMRHLLCAVADRTKLIIVGDTDQLPSVGAGGVLRDIIASGEIPTASLTEIYRQAQDSDIVMNAHKINKGYMPRLDNHEGTDFWFFKIEEKEDVAKTIIQLVSEKIPAKFGFGTDDIQVLTPMRREWDPIGAVCLNKSLQETLNPDGRRVAVRGLTEFRIGDRVMQTKNNYDKDIFNGDTGVIHNALDGNDEDGAIMEVSFDDRLVRFSPSELDELDLCYACTIHKSQGSEYPVVVIPIHTSQYIMLKRNLLYTGITRAKKQCILVGTAKAVHAAISRPDTEVRNTNLMERITEVFDPLC